MRGWAVASKSSLDLLGDLAPRWARAYVTLKEALIMEGVRPEEASIEANRAAMAAFWSDMCDEPWLR